MWSYNEESEELYGEYQFFQFFQIWDTSKPILMCKFNLGCWISLTSYSYTKPLPEQEKASIIWQCPHKTQERRIKSASQHCYQTLKCGGSELFCNLLHPKDFTQVLSAKWPNRITHRITKSSRLSQVKNLKPKISLLHKTKILYFSALLYPRIRESDRIPEQIRSFRSFRSCGRWMQSELRPTWPEWGREEQGVQIFQGKSPKHAAFLL